MQSLEPDESMQDRPFLSSHSPATPEHFCLFVFLISVFLKKIELFYLFFFFIKIFLLHCGLESVESQYEFESHLLFSFVELKLVKKKMVKNLNYKHFFCPFRSRQERPRELSHSLSEHTAP